MNKHCPSDVIQYLAEKYPAAVRHSSIEDYVKFPLHNYIESCTYSKIDIEIVVMFLKEYPEALSKEDDIFYDYELAEKFAEYLNQYCNEDGLSITGLRERIERIPQTHIQYVLREAYMLCGNKNISLDIIKCLLETIQKVPVRKLKLSMLRDTNKERIQFILHAIMKTVQVMLLNF